MEKKVLVLGAGMVAPPLVHFLLELPDIRVTVADMERNKAEALVARSPQGIGLALDFENTKRVKQEIEEAELVISLLPFPYHPGVAELCIQTQTDLITASYTSQEMQGMSEEIKRAGILVLNEIGLDPGIDHMEAMRVIHAVEARGGRIRSFVSFCGGLPAPEANTNPLGYKFSWSPQGVLAASTSPARYLEDGEEVPVSPGDLFKDPRPCSLAGIGGLEGYPNRDSIPYVALYGIPSTRTMLRGTFRYPGWCAFMRAAGILGLLNDRVPVKEGETYSSLMKRMSGMPSTGDALEALRDRLDSEHFVQAVEGLRWIGLLEDDPVPPGAESALQALGARMQSRLQYGPDERDMIVLQHRFEAEYPDSREEIISTLVDYGIPGGGSAMARTVGLPMAVAAKLILQKNIRLKGLHIPVRTEIYLPILEELKSHNISFQEVRKRL